MNMITCGIRALRNRARLMLIERHRRSLLRFIDGGEDLHLDGRITVLHPQNLKLGRNVHIGHDSSLQCLGSITIGDNTIISSHVMIYSYNHDFENPTHLPYGPQNVLKPVHIGKHVWIGARVTIAPGTVIGDGAVIGMGTVISGRIEENAVVVSPKPRIVRFRDPEHTALLIQQNSFLRHAA